MSHGNHHSAGTLTLKHKFNGKVISSQTDLNGHYTLVVFSYCNQIFLLGNVYGFTNVRDNKELFQELNDKIEAIIERFSDVKIILGGDFNCTANDEIDRYPNRQKVNDYLNDFIIERGLVDIWKTNNPSSREFTWKNKAGTLQSRIDFWLVSECLTHLQCVTEIIPTPLTDHKTILLTLQLLPNSEARRCPSYWKLNNTLLFNETVCELVRNKISEYFKLAENEGQFQI